MTDLDAESFLEGRLHHTAWRARRRVAVGFQPGPIGRRTTDLETGLGRSLLPPMTCLHKGNHLLFGRASLFRFHRSLLAPALFTKRLSSPFWWERLRWRLPLSGDDHSPA